MNLPSNEYTFAISVVGDKTKKKYEGQFTVKCLLSVQELVEVGLRMDQYNRGSTTLPAGILRLNRAVAEMEVRTVKAPSWWVDANDGRELLDTNVIFEVFLKALDAEAEYDKRIKDAAEEADKQVEASSSKTEKRSKG